MRNLKRGLGLGVLILLTSACGGGGGGGSTEMVLEGSLIQGGSTETSRVLDLDALAHGAGQTLESVEVCALGVCAETDNDGVWGFKASSPEETGEVLISVKGHGIDASTIVPIPADSKHVFVSLVNSGSHETGSSVYADEVVADGTVIVQHDHSSHSHD